MSQIDSPSVYVDKIVEEYEAIGSEQAFLENLLQNDVLSALNLSFGETDVKKISSDLLDLIQENSYIEVEDGENTNYVFDYETYSYYLEMLISTLIDTLNRIIQIMAINQVDVETRKGLLPVSVTNSYFLDKLALFARGSLKIPQEQVSKVYVSDPIITGVNIADHMFLLSFLSPSFIAGFKESIEKKILGFYGTEDDCK